MNECIEYPNYLKKSSGDFNSTFISHRKKGNNDKKGVFNNSSTIGIPIEGDAININIDILNEDSDVLECEIRELLYNIKILRINICTKKMKPLAEKLLFKADNILFNFDKLIKRRKPIRREIKS